jgi:hypothetical protein
MGFIKSLGSAAKRLKGPEESPTQKATKIKRKEELWEIKDKSRFEEQKKIAAETGRKSARGGGFGSGAMQFGGALNKSLSNVERNLGFNDSLGMGSGLDFGFGNSPAKSKKPMGKVTRIQTGGKTITIREAAPTQEGSLHMQKKPASPYGWMDEVNNFFEG